VPRMGQQGQDIWQQLYKGSQGGIGSSLQGLSDLANGGEAQFTALEAPARRQFQQDQGAIASRFSGMGSGARRSSGHQNAQNAAGLDLAERLQGQRLGLQQNAWRQLLGIHSDLMSNPTHESILVPQKKKWWETLGEGIGGIGGQVAGTASGFGLGKHIFGG
ncbi:MAG TPA: hypothetical protein VIJ14_05390, partial [Rhabdochlamydiaceae bacterium]